MTTKVEDSKANAHSPLRGFQFTRDWLAGEDFSRRYLPAPEDLMRERLRALNTGAWQAWTTDEVKEVHDFNQSAGNHGGGAMAASLGRDDALVVVTGQQPDFLASPLYVIHKALSACAWAKRLSSELARPVTPVFWVASDDDHFAELKRAWMVTFAGGLVDAGSRISRGSLEMQAGTPAYLWDLSESGLRAKEDFRRSLTKWPGGDETTSWLVTAMDDHPNFETFFCFLLKSLLGHEFPVLFVAPRLKVFRRRQVAIHSADMERHRELNTSISKATQDFQTAHYPVTLERDAEAPNFFWLHENKRHRLTRAGSEIIAVDPHTHKESARFSEAHLLDQLNRSPECFAPNVVTRPVVQDVALPTVAYIAGPGELAYLAILGEAYQQFACVRSAVIPRAMVTMQPDGAAEEGAGVQAPDQMSDRLLSQNGNTGKILLDQLTGLMTDTAQSITNMRTSSSGLRPEVQTALDKTERHFLHGIEQLKKRLARQVARDEWNNAARLATITAPAGGLQERMLSPWNFVKAGEWDALARHLAAQVDYTVATPQIATLPPWMDTTL